MALQKDIAWNELDRVVDGLATENEHELRVQREAIPLIFVPGIMGSRLRLGNAGGAAGQDDLPNMRWDPGDGGWMWWHFSGTSATHRKRMLVGDAFSDNFLAVADSSPVGDGFEGIMHDYRGFLQTLRGRDWQALGKLFEFPVYAFGFNWTASAETAGRKLAERIQAIMTEARGVTGRCEKVILITHSMGGLVARSACELSGARDVILGIVHGVQPTTGSPAAYWRMKAGFEGMGPTSRVLGNSGENVTPLLGNIPGGLQLLPNKLHRTNAGGAAWLRITENGRAVRELPVSDPYSEIYRRPAVVREPPGSGPSTNEYWNLTDPDLLNPGGTAPASGPVDPNDNDSLREARPALSPFDQYLRMLAIAEWFHDRLGARAHPRTFNFWGTGQDSADVVELRIESNWTRSDSYPKRGFRGFFRGAGGSSRQAVLQDPSGDGDATVPVSSATKLRSRSRSAPGDQGMELEHQPAYEDPNAQAYAVRAIIALVKSRYEDMVRPIGDFGAPTEGGVQTG